MKNFALALALATTTSAIHLGTKDNYTIALEDIDECIEWEVLEVFEDLSF